MILLINPPYYIDNIFRKSLTKVGALLPPLGLAYIAAVLEKNNYDVKIIDGPALSVREGYGFNDLKNDIKKYNPDLVGITATTPQFIFAKSTAEAVKEINPDVPIVLGGAHISCLPEKTMSEIREIDFGVIGEGENTFLELVRKIQQKTDGTVNGTIYREDGTIKLSPPREFIENIDSIPYPAWHLLPMDLYRPSPLNYRRLPATAIMTSRGCPYRCAYCSKPIHRSKFRAHSPERVVGEIEYLINNFGIKDIQIFDDTFTMDNARAEKICDLIIDKDIDIVWNCMTRADKVTKHLLNKMKKAGCYGIGFGVESGNPHILKRISKGVGMDQIRKAFAWTKEEKIQTRAFFMIGFPGENEETINDSLNFAKELDPTALQLMVATPYPGTPLWELAQQEGTLNIKDWTNFTFYAPKEVPYVPEGMEQEQMLEMYSKAYKSFYLRPSFLLKRVLEIKSFGDINRYFMAMRAVIGM
ncbi:MAG: radical SAM protein [Candidatus Methanoperedens sp.]|nr:radical SAM protein [Candidatus Methanoperedens sp.]